MTRQPDTITINATPDPTGPGPNGEFVIDRNDIRNLGTVLAEDPLRAVQALPGVTSNNDFEARFSLRGAGFARIGIYLDGILLHNAVHNLEGTDLSGSAGILQSGAIREMKLHEGAYSESFAQSSAGALEILLRDGDKSAWRARADVNIAGATMEAEGPAGSACSATGGFRKTYIQDLLAKTLTDPSMAFGIQDTQGRVDCRASRSSTVYVDLIDSLTGLDRTAVARQLGVNALMQSAQQNRFVNAGWTFAPRDKLAIITRAAWMSDSFDDRNPNNVPLGDGGYREWTANSNLLWVWRGQNQLQAGVSARLRSADGFTEHYDPVQNLRQIDSYRGRDLISGAYLAQSWNVWRNHLWLNASGRWDRDSLNRAITASPQAGARFALTPSLDIAAGWGQYNQMPDIEQLGSTLGGPRLRPMRSTHLNAAIEYRAGQKTRVRLEAYRRFDRDLLFQPFFDPRIINGSLFYPPAMPLYENSLSGRARGYEIFIQRNMSRRIAGWVSYGYGRTNMRDAVTGDRFPADEDQTHSANIYANYAFSPTLSFSSKLTYGSGLPAPGFLVLRDGEYYLGSNRNSSRLPAYMRLDFRVNKTWSRGKWKKTLFAEVLNVTNRSNLRFGSLDWYPPASGPAEVTIDKMFPILPNAGFVLER